MLRGDPLEFQHLLPFQDKMKETERRPRTTDRKQVALHGSECLEALASTCPHGFLTL